MLKLTDIISLQEAIDNYTAKLRAIAQKEIDALSISELALVKCVSASSITAMKKAGKDNETIVRTKQHEKRPVTAGEISKYIAQLSDDERAELLATLNP